MMQQPTILDVREPTEYAAGHVDGAINMPPMELTKLGREPTALDAVAKDTPIIVYCLTGSRSNVARVLLGQAGYTNVTNGINQDHVQALLQKGK